ncbi:MAG: OmpA family protein [Syntrophales bacterium]|nr:OmpA family protein [Syntrophales bacterium]
MMKRTSLTFSIVLIMIFFCSTAFAQVKPGTFSVGYSFGGILFDNEHRLSNSPFWGLRLGYDFTRYFGVEASGDYFSTQYDQITANSNRKSNGLNYRLEGILHLLPQYRLTPFIAAGFGGQTINYPPGMQNATASVADYGGGIKYFLTDWLALRADVRQLYVFDNSKKDIEYGIGLSFLFGGIGTQKPLEPPPAPSVYAPMELTATTASESQIDVSWKSVENAASYRVYRDGTFLTSSTSSPLADKYLKASTQYCYTVSAVGADGRESILSNKDCATTLAQAVAPVSAPADITATSVSENQNNVTWKEVGGAGSYKIYRDGLYLTSSKTPFLSDSGLKADTRYCYTVTAVDKAGNESIQSKTACATTAAPMVEQKMGAESAATAALQKQMLEKGRATINIEFDYDKSIVKPQYHKEIQKFADVMKANPSLKVVIEGHTDNVGAKNYNLRLSKKRAESVRDYMIKKFGVQGSRLTAKGYGMSKPIASNKTAAGKKKNRRVEAVVVFNKIKK